MSKKEWGYILRAMKDVSRRYHRTATIIVLSVLQGINPFISIVLMGKLLDAVSMGADADTLIFYAVAAISANRLLGILIGRLRENFNQRNEYIKDIEAAGFVQKSMAMDYEYLEDMKVQSVRQNTNKKSGSLGIVGSTLYHIEPIVTGMVSILLAVCIMIPLFRKGALTEQNFLGGTLSAILLLAALGVLLVR